MIIKLYSRLLASIRRVWAVPLPGVLVRDLRDNSLLRELVPAAERAPATLVFSELLNNAEGREAF